MTAEILCTVLLRLFRLDPTVADEHSRAVVAAATSSVPAEVLVAVAYHESKFDSRALSWRDRHGQRQTGVWSANVPPKGARPSWYCGVTQVGGWVPWETCQRFREDVPLAYMEASQHLERWLKSPPCSRRDGHDRWQCALAGYGGGWNAIRNMSTDYADRVLRTAARFRSIAKKYGASS